MARSRRHRPVFIVGAGRSGTTLLRLMINRHPDIVVPAEAQFVPELIDRLPDDRPLSAAEVERALDFVVTHERWRDWQQDPAALRQRILCLQAPTLAELIAELYRQVSDDAGKPQWGDKTPRNTRYIDRLHGLFPDAQFIHIIRDARDVAKSKRRLAWVGPFLFRSASVWDEAVRKTVLSGRSLPVSLYRLVRYEDLVRDPEGELRKVCDFLNIDFSADMLAFHETVDTNLTPFERTMKAHENLRRPPRPDDVERWRREMSRTEVATVEAIAGKTMAMVGQRLAYPKRALLLRLLLWLPNRLMTWTLSLIRRLMKAAARVWPSFHTTRAYRMLNKTLRYLGSF